MRNDITHLNRHLDEKAKPVLKIKDGFVFDRETKLNESSGSVAKFSKKSILV